MWLKYRCHKRHIGSLLEIQRSLFSRKDIDWMHENLFTRFDELLRVTIARFAYSFSSFTFSTSTLTSKKILIWWMSCSFRFTLLVRLVCLAFFIHLHLCTRTFRLLWLVLFLPSFLLTSIQQSSNKTPVCACVCLCRLVSNTINTWRYESIFAWKKSTN